MIRTVISRTYAAVALQFSHQLLQVKEIKANEIQPSSSDGDECIFRHIAFVKVTIISLHAQQEGGKYLQWQ